MGRALPAIKRMIKAARKHPRESKAARDVLILRLLFDLGLRNAELRTLDLEHIDGEHLWVKRKGRGDRQLLTMPAATIASLGEWLSHRGHEPGPLIPSMDKGGDACLAVFPASGFGRSSKGLVRRRASTRGPTASATPLRPSLPTRPAVMRLAIQKFLGHSSPAPAGRYIDNLDDKGGKAAALVAALLGPMIEK